MILRRVALVCLALTLSACGDMSWEQLTSFPDFSGHQQPEPTPVPPEPSPDAAPPVEARPIAPPLQAYTAPVAEAPAGQSDLVPVPQIAPPDAGPVITAAPMARPANVTSYYCHQMAADAGHRAILDGFDEGAQQAVVDTTLRQCLSLYGNR